MKYLSLAFLFVLAAINAGAQEVTTTVTPPTAPTTVRMAIPLKAPTEIIAASSVNTIKGAPFSAEAVSESVQMLSDGNRITRSYTTKMYRDSEGRFRREGTGAPGGGYVMSGGATTVFGLQDSISIFDPVEGVRYSLNTKNKTARRMNFKPLVLGSGTTVISGAGAVVTSATTVGGSGSQIVTTTPMAKAQIESAAREGQVYTQIAPVGSVGGVTVVSPVKPDSKYETRKESLGTRSIEGVEAEGTRVTTTIPAGAIGNERPIEMVYESWYSKELRMTVFSKNTDPRFGETTYRLLNIDRSEPDRSLFVPPSDYKIITEPSVNVYMTKPQ